MWLIKKSPSLFVDLYELTMAQVYFQKKMSETAYFEVAIRRLPEHWGFFVMAGLAEVQFFLNEFRFTEEDTDYLRSTRIFSDDFLSYLIELRPQACPSTGYLTAERGRGITIRCLPEGTVFFPDEPIFEVAGPLICAQILESFILNILGFSIIEATLAARISIAANRAAVVDFGLRRCQGPAASVRSARAAQMAGFTATSNVFAARELDFVPTGTMAHSFVQVHDSEEQSFRSFAESYGENAILLVDTYDSIEGIRKAAKVARKIFDQKGIKIKGIRLDSGDLVELSKFSRRYFQEQDVSFLKIFASGDLDEFKIYDFIKAGAQIDGFGIGTNFAVSRSAPAVEIVYKIVQYGDKEVLKTSPDKQSRAGRKTITRLVLSKAEGVKNKCYKKDIVSRMKANTDDLLKPFESIEKMQTIQNRLTVELSALDDSIKQIRNPGKYIVEFI